MDAIYIDPSYRQQVEQEQEEKESEKHKGKGWRGDTVGGGEISGRRSTAGNTSGFLNAVQIGVGGAARRREYSLAPCHHLFVSGLSLVLGG